MPLPDPIGRQKEVLYLPAKGSTVVLGTAGSGKTTMAVLRAAHLANTHTQPGKRVLLVTFNRTLIAYLRCMASSELAHVNLETYHKFALGYLSRRQKRRISILGNPSVRDALIASAVDRARKTNGFHPIYERPLEMLSLEFEWIGKSGIRTAEAYTLAERVGRSGTRVDRKDRGILFGIYQEYQRLRSAQGYDHDWEDVASAVLDEFLQDADTRMYQHIVIDEGQDFSPAMLRSLAAAIPNDGSLMFFGDVAQQIYGTRVSWRSAGLAHPAIWRFEENYRNSRQIAQLALAISQMPYFLGEADLVEPREPHADGPLPTLVYCQDKEQEFKLAVDQAQKLGRTQSVAILMRNRNAEKRYLRALKAVGMEAQRLHREAPSWSSLPGISIGTYYSAKGLEFDTVILPDCSDDVLPDPSKLRALGSLDDAKSEEGRLLYVAVTRAKQGLIMTFSGNITPLLPLQRHLYQRVRL